jgi:hypothetical protein
MVVALYMPMLNLTMHPRAGRGQHNHPPLGRFRLWFACYCYHGRWCISCTYDSCNVLTLAKIMAFPNSRCLVVISRTTRPETRCNQSLRSTPRDIATTSYKLHCYFGSFVLGYLNYLSKEQAIEIEIAQVHLFHLV